MTKNFSESNKFGKIFKKNKKKTHDFHTKMENNFCKNNWKSAKTHEAQGILEKPQGILEKTQGTGGLSLAHPPKVPPPKKKKSLS